MLCDACHTALRLVYERKADDLHDLHIEPPYPLPDACRPYSSIIYPTPRSLYTALVAGCLICRMIWTLTLANKVDSQFNTCQLTQRALESNRPKTFEEFSDQYAVFEDDSQFAPGLPKDAEAATERNEPGTAILDGVESSKRSRKASHKWSETSPWAVLRIFSFPESKLSVWIDVKIADKPLCNRTFMFGLFTNTNFSKLPHLPPRVRCSSTAGTDELWRYWFRTCSESHDRCRAMERERSFVPDRLIQIIPGNDVTDNFKWRLVCRTHIRSDHVQYLTLSHCWGSAEHLSLTRGKYLSFFDFSLDSCLPKSYRDAFRITASLGFEFIWIDSLCIIQDDVRDWHSQSSMMGSVYRNSRCNIAATWASDSNDGCFSERDPSIIDTSGTLIPRNSFAIDFYMTLNDLYDIDILQAPLNKRAWVVQERYLARRQLNFSKHQVYWECLELTASEQNPTGWETCSKTNKPTLNPQNEDDFNRVWPELVEYYSNCTATVRSDRMVALAGLASEFRIASRDEYLAGLWKTDLRKQLCWKVDAQQRVNCRRILPYIAPTWSWANIDGPIIFDYMSSNLTYRVFPPKHITLVEVVDVFVNSKSSLKLHSFTSSGLVLKGIAIWARIASVLGETDAEAGAGMYGFRPVSLFEAAGRLPEAIDRIRVDWDENISPASLDPELRFKLDNERKGDLLFMCITHNIGWMKFDIQGLILIPSLNPIDQGSFVRIGVFQTPDRDSISVCIAKRLERLERAPLGRLDDPLGGEDIDLDDARLADLVHTVTII